MDQAIRLYRVSFPFNFKADVIQTRIFITQLIAVCAVGSCALSTLGTGRVWFLFLSTTAAYKRHLESLYRKQQTWILPHYQVSLFLVVNYLLLLQKELLVAHHFYPYESWLCWKFLDLIWRMPFAVNLTLNHSLVLERWTRRPDLRIPLRTKHLLNTVRNNSLII